MFVRAMGAGLGLLLMLCGIAGCATGYRKDSAWNALLLTGGGFGDERISDSAYFVYFSGNGYASSERVVNFWLYRCAELTLEKGFDYMVIRPGEKQAAAPDAEPSTSPHRRVSFRDGPDQAPTQIHDGVWRPDRDGGLPVVKTKGGGTHYYYVPGQTITTWSSRGTVLMHRAPLPDELVWAMDARKIRAQLDPYVKSDGKTTPPTREALIVNAMVTHENITFGSDKSKTVAAPGATLPARDMQDIRARFEDVVMGFHSMFRTRRQLTGMKNGGTIELALTVTPSGDISESRIVSTTFKDQDFVDAVVNGIRRLTYPPKDVATTSVASFPITFQPLEFVRAKTPAATGATPAPAAPAVKSPEVPAPKAGP